MRSGYPVRREESQGREFQTLALTNTAGHDILSVLAVRSAKNKVRVWGRIAQLVERFVYTEDVTGSSPVSPTQIDKQCSGFVV